MTTSLTELSQQFELWREQAKQGRIPQNLKQQVFALMSEYSVHELSHHLNLKINTVQKWQKQTETKSVKFIPLKTQLPNATSVINHTPTVTVVLPNEIKLILTGQTVKELVEFTVILNERMGS
jgi:hypothetical protein